MHFLFYIYSFLSIILFSILSCALPGDIEESATPIPKSIAFIGNSTHNEGIDFNTLRAELDYHIDHLWEAGVTTAWMYATLYRRILVDSIPEYVFMTSNLNIVTIPDSRATGLYLAKIEQAAAGFPEIMDTVNTVLHNADKIVDNWDFNASVAYTFLPRIIELAGKYGFTFIFSRMRIEKDAKNPQWESEIQKKYRQELVDYLTRQGALFLEYSFEPAIEVHDFADSWHLNPLGRKKLTAYIRDDLSDIFQGEKAFHQLTENFLLSPITIEYPGDGTVIQSAQDNEFKVAGDKDVKWSYYIENCPDYEVFLGLGYTITSPVPPFSYLPRLVTIFAYDGETKEHVVCSLYTSPGTNIPPVVNAGEDLISYIGHETEIRAIAQDDRLLPAALQYTWAVIRGSGVLTSDDSPATTLIPTAKGLVIVRVTVSDGEYERIDDVSINVNEDNEFHITSPTYGEIFVRGDTVVIRWEVIDVEDCLISVSYNGGRNYELLIDAALSVGDSTWGCYPWIIPDDVPATESAYLKLANYAGTVSTISYPFIIQSR